MEGEVVMGVYYQLIGTLLGRFRYLMYVLLS